MSLTQNRWFRRLGFAAIATLGLGAAALTTTSAQAHDFGYYRAPVVQHTAFIPRIFFGFGGWHHGHHGGYGDHWDHNRR